MKGAGRERLHELLQDAYWDELQQALFEGDVEERSLQMQETGVGGRFGGDPPVIYYLLTREGALKIGADPDKIGLI